MYPNNRITNINNPSGIICVIEKKRINDGEIFSNSKSCQSPPNNVGSKTIKLKLDFIKLNFSFIFDSNCS